MQQKHLNYIQLFSHSGAAHWPNQSDSLFSFSFTVLLIIDTHTHIQTYRQQTVEWGRQRGAKQPNNRSESEESKLQCSPPLSLSLLFAAACSCMRWYVRVYICVFECALRAKLIFLFIKKKSKYICIFVCCAAFFFLLYGILFWLPLPKT